MTVERSDVDNILCWFVPSNQEKEEEKIDIIDVNTEVKNNSSTTGYLSTFLNTSIV